MIISSSFQYVYVAVPKTASVSITDVLMAKYGGKSYGNQHNVVIPPDCIRYYTFCTVRHPYTRAFSFYNFIRNDFEHRCNRFAREHTWEQFMEWMVDLDALPKITMGEEEEWDNESKMEQKVLEDSIVRLNGRDSNQVDFLSYFLGVNYLDKIDLIIRVEELEEGFQRLPFVQDRVRIPWLNTSKRSRGWRESMNGRIEKLIYQWAEPDFHAFNYEREKF